MRQELAGAAPQLRVTRYSFANGRSVGRAVVASPPLLPVRAPGQLIGLGLQTAPGQQVAPSRITPGAASQPRMRSTRCNGPGR
jgi:hypothetical protein